ncbi:ECF transporter S component [bacterium]|nr:ECF transporter S component [bacterium]
MKYSGRDLLLGGLFLALALVLPFFFHAVGLGSVFLPMFYPIIIAGFLVAFPVAVVVGFISPLTSSLLTGMPPLFPPIAFIMMAEGVVLAGIPALLYQKSKIKVLPTLIITIFAERLVLLAAVVLSAKWLDLPEGVLGLASLLRGLPGIIIIFIIIPPLIKKLERKMRTMAIME